MSITALSMTIEMDPVGNHYQSTTVTEDQLRQRIESLTAKVHQVFLLICPLNQRTKFNDVPLESHAENGSVRDADLTSVLNSILEQFPIDAAAATSLNAAITGSGLEGFLFPVGQTSKLQAKTVDLGFRSGRNYCETSEGIVCYGHRRVFVNEQPVLWNSAGVTDGRMDIFVTGRFVVTGLSAPSRAPRAARAQQAGA